MSEALGSGASTAPCVSDDGTRIVFASGANNLVGSDANGAGDVFALDCEAIVTSYCTARTKSQGCVPAVSGFGQPSASSSASFDVTAVNVLNHSNGLMFYGFAPAAAPYMGGFMCVSPPLVRTPLQSSNGSPSGVDCSGVFQYDLNARIQSGLDPNLFVGQVAHCQYWSLDPFTTPPTNLSDALRCVIQP